MAIDWDTYHGHSRDEPITEEMLQTYNEVVERIEHVCTLIGKYRPLFKNWSLEKTDVGGEQVYCKFSYQRSGCSAEFEDDTFPSKYFLMTDGDIETAETLIKAAREKREHEKSLQKENLRLAQKRAEFERLKKELGA